MLNETASNSNWNSPYGVVLQVIVWVIVIGLSLETIVGNAMVVIAYKIERNISKQVSNRYIVSLAISDLIIGIEGFPLFTVYVLNGERWPLGSIACETWLFLDYTLCLVSILTVLLITADRYLSVCHTAKYLKWQNPTKTQMLIVFSWLIPAAIFGIMIYGWKSMSGSSESMIGGECSAPFLSNPYVNMGMYVVYYWTTLVAMLILYKGIHQAAKNLEQKAKAKERRHIALILSQRLGTQVGVSLMLQSRAERENEEQRSQQGSSAKNIDDEAEPNMSIIEEERSQLESFFRRESNELPFPAPHSSAVNSRRQSAMERDSLLEQPYENDDEPLKPTVRLSLSSTTSRCSVSGSLHHKEPARRSTLSKDHCAPALGTRHCVKHPRHSNRSRSSARSTASRRKSSNTSVRSQFINQNVPDRPVFEEDLKRPDRWVFSMKKRIVRALERRSKRTSVAAPRPSYSSDSSSSSDETDYASQPVTSCSMAVPELKVNDEDDEAPSRLSPAQPKNETFLSASGVSRKISSISTALSKEKIISSIFSPISAFNRRRKRTKAEKRAHKAFRTITFIVGCFAVLWSPYYIMATVYGFCKGECIPSLLYTLSYYMCYLNSSGNPFAYALANRQFRTAFLRMLRGNFNKIS